MKRPAKTLLTLLVYIGLTVGLYYVICLLNERPFTELHFLYAALIGCMAYAPRWWRLRKLRK